jgi:endoglucanase
MKIKFNKILLLISISVLITYSCKPKVEVEQYKWETIRGVNVDYDIEEEDFKKLNEIGAKLVRIVFAVSPFMELEEPYSHVESSYENLDRVLDLCEKYGIKAVIDPHRFPGTMHPWTMLDNDPFWTDFHWHDKVISIWERIANQCKDRGDVIAGYALLNEPALPYNPAKGSPADINLLYEKLISAIRKHDKKHTIILSGPRMRPPTGEGRCMPYIAGLAWLDAPPDNNLCYEIHMYDPMSFSHQGVWEESEFVKYPDFIDGQDWNIETIQRYMMPAKMFIDKYNVPMFVGEFSCPRWTGDHGNQYLSDQIEVYEEFGFSWAYHAFRENQLWDMEMCNYNIADSVRVESTPRKELFIKAFNR